MSELAAQKVFEDLLHSYTKTENWSLKSEDLDD